LEAIEAKIEINRRMNETLEEIAGSIFESRKRDENWAELKLADVCNIYDGPHATPKLAEAGPIFLGISNLANGLLNLSETNHLTEEDLIKWTRRVTPSAGDVVFSYETRLGQAAIIPGELRCCLGRRMGLLRPKPEKTEGIILLRAYLTPEFQETVRQRTVPGSTVDRIPLKDMGLFPIRLPQGEALTRLARQLRSLRDRVEHNEKNSRVLAVLRNILLPKLASDELRIRNAEQFIRGPG
jgi:type I restriction enzyme, S subunit